MNLTKVYFFSSIVSIVHGNFVGSLMKIKNEQVCSLVDKRYFSSILYDIRTLNEVAFRNFNYWRLSDR